MPSVRIFARASRRQSHASTLATATAAAASGSRRQCFATIAAAAARRFLASVSSPAPAPASASASAGPCMFQDSMALVSSRGKMTTFFFSNRIFDRSRCRGVLVAANNSSSASGSRNVCTASTTTTTTTTTTTSSAATASQQVSQGQSTDKVAPLPHRLRQLRRQQQQQQQQKQQQQQQQISQPDGQDSPPLPPDASSLLTTQAAAQPARSFRRNLSACLSLSKPRLTVLVVLTAVVPYALYPVPEMLLLTPTMTDATMTSSLSPLTLLFLTTGTALCSACANALNMLYEPDTDAKMTRTRNRPLVRRLLAKRSAALFAVLAGVVGVAGLYAGVNPTVAALGAVNIVLYAGIYTPLKRVTALNTWVGALVGGIPPLMGWAAAAGEKTTTTTAAAAASDRDNDDDNDDGSWRSLLLANDGSSIGGWLLAGLLFAWQFPHFMALSWPIRDEYRAAGLRMLAWTNARRNARVALRYSLVFVPLCAALCAAGVTDWYFVATSLPVNAWLAREAFRFWRHQGHAGSARGLFWASVWHLPVVLTLAMLHKRDMWSRARRALGGGEDVARGDGGGGDGDEEGLWEDEAEEMAVAVEDMAGMAVKT